MAKTFNVKSKKTRNWGGDKKIPEGYEFQVTASSINSIGGNSLKKALESSMGVDFGGASITKTLFEITEC
jgi:hypothetical protein